MLFLFNCNKKQFISLLILTLLTAFTVKFSYASETSSPTNTNEKIVKTLETNRLLLNEFETEYKKYFAISPELAIQNVKDSHADLKHKIEILQKDRTRLLSHLSENDQAKEWVKDLNIKNSLTYQQKKRAKKFFKKLLTIQKNFTYHYLLSTLHEQALECVAKQKYETAVSTYQKIILINPQDDQAYLLMGHIYMLLDQYGQAEEAFSNAAAIDPRNLQEITPVYKNLILENPDNDKTYTQLGYAYLIVGKFEDATAAFDNALAINPDNFLAMKGLQITRTETRAMAASITG